MVGRGQQFEVPFIREGKMGLIILHCTQRDFHLDGYHVEVPC